MWLLYNILFPVLLALALPYYLLRMVRRGGYARGFLQRVGIYDAALAARLAERPRVWVHAVSVGETLVALRFMEGWRRKEPGVAFVLSVNTSTGRALAAKSLHPEDAMVYFPLDNPWVLARVFRFLRPACLILTECEFWPNLIRMACNRGIPVLLINGRMSDRSFRGYRRFRVLFRPVLRMIRFLCVQGAKDRERYMALGVDADRILVTGSAKYDVALQAAADLSVEEGILADSGLDRTDTILLGGSTWSGEEAVLLDLFARLRGRFPALRLILVPRHAERRDEVVEGIRGRGLSYVQRSKGRVAAGAGKPDVVLADTTGELRHLYAIASVVFVGKSLTQHGGQNPIEPAACAKPVLVGPNMENFRDIMADFISADAMIQVRDAGELEMRIGELLADESMRSALGQKALGVVGRNRGSLEAMVRAAISAGQK